RPVGDGVKRRAHDADLKEMVVIRSPSPQLVPFKLHRFGQQRLQALYGIGYSSYPILLVPCLVSYRSNKNPALLSHQLAPRRGSLMTLLIFRGQLSILWTRVHSLEDQTISYITS
ncbi:hypothetical protein, partial [Aeromonas caviae]|uniref:hypothetical protein n=1 Tax=Aeromonas caviae TaxID=648 RepID=UPI0025B6C534